MELQISDKQYWRTLADQRCSSRQLQESGTVEPVADELERLERKAKVATTLARDCRYDARKHQAYWLDIQEYLEQHFDAFAQALESESESMTVRIPVSNRLTVRAIDRFRTLQLDRLNKAEKEES